MALGLFKLKPLNNVNQNNHSVQTSITSRKEDSSYMASEKEAAGIEAAADETEKRECLSRPESNGHKFFWRVANTEPAKEILPVEANRGSTGEALSNDGEAQPILVRGDAGELGICIKPIEDLSVRRICEIVGWDKTVRTIDVHTQQDGPVMTMSALNRYWESCMETEQSFSPSTHVPSFQSMLLNVVSLSLEHTDFENIITVPQAARDLDLTHSLWPKDEDSPNSFNSFYKFLANCAKPNAMLYALISPKYCFTDFHIDFGGSSVWYHVVKGEKVFLACPPSPTNLKRFKSWAGSSKQSSTFFGEGCEGMIRITVKEGDTVFLPGGWPHAVSTTQHSAVEDRLDIPQSCRYPSFAHLMWLAACRLIERVENGTEDRNITNRTAAAALAHHLESWRRSSSIDDAQPLTTETECSGLPERIPVTLDVGEVFARLRKIAGQMEWEEALDSQLSNRWSTKPLDGDWTTTKSVDTDADWTVCEGNEQSRKRRRHIEKRDKSRNPSVDKAARKSKSFSLIIGNLASPKASVSGPVADPDRESMPVSTMKTCFKRSLSANSERNKNSTNVRDRLKKKLGFRKR